jgi:hypothetical protein
MSSLSTGFTPKVTPSAATVRRVMVERRVEKGCRVKKPVTTVIFASPPSD